MAILTTLYLLLTTYHLLIYIDFCYKFYILHIMNFRLIVATKNTHKMDEIKNILSFKGVELLSLNDFKNLPDIKETGKTFYENALIKAKTINKYTGIPTIADDSGLEVYYLNNSPGIYSARYAGKNSKDSDRIQKLLKELDGVPQNKRDARFVCSMVLVDKQKVFNVTGFCEGTITDKPKGNNGFGYDPVFYLKDIGKTMAQLSMKQKNSISHRANALKKMKEILKEEYNLK